MSKNNETMSPEAFIAWATAEIEIAKGEGGEAGAQRLDNVRKQVDVAKAFSFEGDVAGLPVERVEAGAPTSTEVSPDKAQNDKGDEGVATNIDEVAKQLTEDLATLKKALGDTDTDTDTDTTDGTDDSVKDTDKSGDAGDTDDAVDDVSGVDKVVSNDKPFAWPDDLNAGGDDLTWGADGENGLGGSSE